MPPFGFSWGSYRGLLEVRLGGWEKRWANPEDLPVVHIVYWRRVTATHDLAKQWLKYDPPLIIWEKTL